MFLSLLLACNQAQTVSTPAATEDDTIGFVEIVQPAPEVDCDDYELGLGLSLTTVPADADVLISAIDVDGNLLYQETTRSDACGIATPFESVSSEDFGGPFDGWAFGVYALVLSDSSFYMYTGVLNEDDMPSLPISTQWYWDEEKEDWYAIRDQTYGVMIGNMMIP